MSIFQSILAAYLVISVARHLATPESEGIANYKRRNERDRQERKREEKREREARGTRLQRFWQWLYPH